MEDKRPRAKPVRIIKTACGRKIRPDRRESKEVRGLFSPAQLDYPLSTFDFIKPGGDEGVLLRENPGLLAMKNKRARASAPRRQISIRPNTSSLPDPAAMMNSLLNKRPLSPLKEPDPASANVIEKRLEDEKRSLMFKEDPVAYFSKRKDGRGHRFIYLKFLHERGTPLFSPYELRKVTSNELGGEYFTMSANGVTHMLPDGDTDQMSLDQWAKEAYCYDSMRKLRLFQRYFWWKPLQLWRKFVKYQRYKTIGHKLREFVFYSNPTFFETVRDAMYNSSDTMLKKYLMNFITQKKYKIEDFVRITDENHVALREEFEVFMGSIADILIQLDEDIRDPERLVVNDTDFDEIKRQNPNLGQLIVLERKKENEEQRRLDIVQRELVAFGDFVRLMDYVLLEGLLTSCKECWYIADDSVSQDMASVFVIEVSFTKEGDIGFVPSLEKLKSSVCYALDQSIEVLNRLPRILTIPKMRHLLRERIPELTQLFEKGPNFARFAATNAEYVEMRKHILEVIEKSYADALVQSKMFLEFFPIYEVLLVWHPEDYIKPRGGEDVEIELTATSNPLMKTGDTIIFNPSQEPVVDIEEIRKDIERFDKYEKILTRFRPCPLRGALHIDSRSLRNTLLPIPSNSLSEMRDTLMKLILTKIDRIKQICRYCRKRLKREPTSLATFVDFSAFLQRAQQLEPFLKNEVLFLDDMYVLFDDAKFKLEGSLANPTHTIFEAFQEDLQTGMESKKLNDNRYEFDLQHEVRKRERKINSYHDQFTTFPTEIRGPDIEAMLPTTKKMRDKIVSLEPVIQELLYFQDVLQKPLCDFALYPTVREEGEYMVSLFECTLQWTKVANDMVKVPLAVIDMAKFISDVERIHEMALKLRERTVHDNELIKGVEERVARVYPHLAELDKLASSRMQQHHWQKLFQECGKPDGYYSQIKIEELVAMGILDHKEEIAHMTSTSQGESQVETEFHAMQKHWNTIELPLTDATEERLTLGNLSGLFSEIVNTQIHLQQMLRIPYVRSISEQIISLGQKLEDVAQILELWEIFQSRWQCLAPIMCQDDIKKVLPKSVTKFQMVKRRWNSLVKHTLADKRLFQVCSFPALLNLLIESNKTLTKLRGTLGKYLMNKRIAFPRLFFIGDDELITLLSTTDASTWSTIAAKMFMHMRTLDTHVKKKKQKQSEEEDDSDKPKKPPPAFEKAKVNGLVGKNGDVLAFGKPVRFNGSQETWIQGVIDEMKTSVRAALSASVAQFSTSKMTDWVAAAPTYIALLTLQIIFSRDIAECFASLETNAKAFHTYENTMRMRLGFLREQMARPNDPNELRKLSSVATMLTYQISQIRPLNEIAANYNPAMTWKSRLRFTFNVQSQQCTVFFDDYEAEHGYEYFGDVGHVMFTPSTERALNNMLNAVANSAHPYIFGCNCKSKLLDWMAAMFGRFICFPPSFVYSSNVLFERVLISVAATGSWVLFRNIDTLSHEKLCYIYDMVRNIGTPSDDRIDFQKTCRIMFSGSSEFFKSNKIPPHLRTTLKPIALAAPDYRLLALTKLSSLGFTAIKRLPGKIITVITTILHTFPTIKHLSIMAHILAIADMAYDIVQQMMQANQMFFLNYYDETLRAEDYSLARATYMRFVPYITPELMPGLISIIHSTFHVFDDIKECEKYLKKPGCFEIDESEKMIEETLDKFIDSGLPKDYLVEKCNVLYNLMLQYPFILVTGPSKSGKSLLVDSLGKVFTELAKNAEIINRFAMIRPCKIIDIYQNTEDIFGSTEEESKLEAMILDARKFEKTHHCFLRFHGRADTELFAHIESLMNGNRFCFESLNSCDFGDQFHVIIETDSLCELTPSMLNHCGILSMERQDCVCNVPSDLNIDLNEVMPLIRTTFEGFLKENSPENLHLADDLEAKAVDLFTIYAQKQEVSDSMLEKCLVHSMFIVYSGVLDEELSTKLEERLLSVFEIKLNVDWSGFACPPHFAEVYKGPTLKAVNVVGGDFEPLNFSRLNESPAMRKNDRNARQQYVNDYVVRVAPFIPRIFTASLVMENGGNLFISGPELSGKSSLLFYILRDNPAIEPLFIPSSPKTDINSIVRFIKQYSVLSVKEYMMVNHNQRFVLVFEDVSPNDIQLSECIRMIIEKKCIPSFRDDDHLVEYVQLRKFVVIVTSNSPLHEFSPRFGGHFTPIHIDKPNRAIQEDVITAIGRRLDVTERDIMIAFNRCQSDSCSFMKALDLLPYCQKDEVLINKVLEFEAGFFGGKRYLDREEVALPEIKLNTIENVATVAANQRMVSTAMDDLRDLITSFNNSHKEILKLNVCRPLWYSFWCVRRSITYPCGNLCIRGNEATGKYTICRLAAFAEGFEFFMINEYSDLADVIEKFCDSQQQIVVFAKSTDPAILHFAKTKEFVDVFEPARLTALYLKVMKALSMSNELATAAHNKLLDWMRIRMHFIIAAPKDFDRSATMFCYNLDFGYDELELWEVTAADTLSRNRNIPTSFAKIVAQVHANYGRTDNQFFDFIELILANTEKAVASISEMQEKGSLALSFLQRLQEEKPSDEEILNSNMKRIAEIEAMNSEKEDVVSEEKKAIDKKVSDYEAHVKDLEKNIAHISDFITDMNHELVDLLAIVDQVRNKVNRISDKDIETLRVFADSPPPQLRALLTILAGYMDLPIDYDTGAKVALMSPTFLDDIKEKIDHLNVTSKTLEKVDAIFQETKIEVKDFEAIAPVSVVLFRWINAIHRYATRQNKVKETQKSLDESKQELEKFISDKSEEMQSTLKRKEEVETEIRGLQALKTELETVTETKQKYEKKLEAINMIMSEESSYVQDMRKEIQEVAKIRQGVPNNALLTAAYLAYCGDIDVHQREELLSYVASKIEGYTDEHPLLQVGLMLASDEPPSSGFSSNIIIEGRCAYTLTRTPVIEDPDGFLKQYIVAHSKKVVECSALNRAIEKTVIDAITEGNTLLIHDYGCDNPLIRQLIRAYNNRSAMGKSQKVQIGTQEVAFDPSFRLFIVSRVSDDLSRVTLCKASSLSLMGTEEVITRIFVKNQSLKLYETLKSISATEIDNKCELLASKRAITLMLASLNSAKENWFEDQETIKHLLTTIRNICNISQKKDEIKTVSSEVQQALANVQEKVKLCQILWECISRYLSSSKLFRFNQFTSVIESALGAKKDPVQELLKAIMIRIPLQYSVACFLIAAFLSQKYSGAGEEDDLDEVIDRFCRPTKADRYSALVSGFQRLKLVSFPDLFDTAYQVISELLQGGFAQPPFLLGYFTEANQTLIISSHVNDPTPLLFYFMQMRNRMDSFVLYCITEDMTEKQINEIRSEITKGMWVALDYSNPTIANAMNLGQIVGGLHLSAKVIILATSMRNIPSQFIDRANVYNFEEHPSIRTQMIQIYQHFSSLIRSTTDPLKIKKMCFICAMLMSVINYRTSVLPSGFTEFPRVNEIVIKEVFEYIRGMIDNNTGFPVRNIRDYMMEHFFGSACLDTFDRRKLRAHVYTVFSGNFDEPYFVEPYSLEGEVWKFPPDAPITNYVHFFEKYPQFTTTDILYMDPAVAEFIGKWNLTAWLSEPLSELRRPSSKPVWDLFDQLPLPLPVVTKDIRSPFELYIRSEITVFNKAIQFIQSTQNLSVPEDEKPPREWEEAVGYGCASSLKTFIEYLHEKRSFLTQFTSSAQPANVKYLNDVQGLFQAFLQERAVKTGVTVDELDLAFCFNQQMVDSLHVSGVYLEGGHFTGSLSRSDQLIPHFKKIQLVTCYTVPKETHQQKVFLCPMFNSPPAATMALKRDMDRIDGETRNFIWYIPVATNLTDRYLISNNTSFVCKIPEEMAQFVQ